MQALIRGFLAVVVLTFTGALGAQVQTFYYLTLLDSDGDQTTGCSVEITDNNGLQIMPGVDYLLRATVTGGALVSIETASCTTGIITNINVLTWVPDTAHPTYTLSGSFIEYRLPNIAIAANSVVGFASSTDISFGTPAATNVIFTSGGNPISLAPLLTRAGGLTAKSI